MANSPLPSSESKELRSRLRDYELSIDRAKRKRLGQFFTGPRASSLLAALSVQGNERTVVDPMAGHGDLLQAVAMRLSAIEHHAALTGVEIDAATAQLASERLALCTQQGEHTANVINKDSFSPRFWETTRPDGGYDLVIANPPYVRYQSHSDATLRDEWGTTAATARAALHSIAEITTDQMEYPVWSALIGGYSGLADLSLPSWFLCALLAKPNGIVALVVPKAWMSRQYAKVIQYLQLRFFEPLLVVEEHGVGWFQDAQVPTTLVVSRRLTVEESVIPIMDRNETGSATTIAAVRPDAADSRSLVGRAFLSLDPDGEFAAQLHSAGSCAVDGIAARSVSWSEQAHKVMTRSRGESWLRAAGESTRAISVSSKHTSGIVPAPLNQFVASAPTSTITTISGLGFQVGQGLRTGCNAFFYVDALGTSQDGEQSVCVSKVLGGDTVTIPDELLQPVVRRQNEVPGFAVDVESTRGRVLVLRGWRLPEDSEATDLQVFPDPLATIVRRAADTAVRTNGRKIQIPNLSAVKTNCRVRTTAGGLFSGIGATRRWYMLPDFAQRHKPVVFVARVNSGTPSFLLNTDPNMLIDANFSTIYGSSDRCPSLALLALLNSTWCRACTERIGTPMGGGALKLEAAQLRELPLPVLGIDAVAQLVELGKSLASQIETRSSDLARSIDAIVLRAFGIAPHETETIRHRLLMTIDESREQRARSPREVLL